MLFPVCAHAQSLDAGGDFARDFVLCLFKRVKAHRVRVHNLTGQKLGCWK
jgi:hypothetical protein